MKRFMTTILLILTLAYLAFGLLLFIKQRDFLYFPSAPIVHNYSSETIQHDGERLKITILNPGKSTAVLYFGGNGENVDHNAAPFTTLLSGHTVYLIHYRGYGGSSGKPSEKALYSDALYIYDLIHPHHPEISVIGRSLGSAIAGYVAANRTVAKLILITPFDSIVAIARKQFPAYPLSLLMTDQYNAAQRVKNIHAPTLILLASNDMIINQSHSQQLIEHFPPNQVSVKTIPNTGHNSISTPASYWTSIQNFLASQS